MFIEIAIGGALIASAVAYAVFRRKSLSPVQQALPPATDPLIHKLVWAKYLENVGDYGRLVAQQYERNQKLHDLLIQTLQAKFSKGELTFDRYYGVIELTSRELKAAMSKLIPVLEAMDLDGDYKSDSEKTQQVKVVLDTCDSLNDSLDKLLEELTKLSDQGQKSNSDVEYLLKNLQDLTDRVKNYS